MASGRLRIGYPNPSTRTLTAESGSYSLSGQAVTLTHNGAVSGFTPTPGVFSASGTAGHDQPLTITYLSGTFASRSFGSGAPWLYDRVSQQFVNGTNEDAYNGLSNGALINVGDVWQDNALTGVDSAYYSTSRTRRHARSSALYTNAGHTPEKMGVGRAVWPSAWGSQTNTRLYVSWWYKSTLGLTYDAPGGDGPSTKPFRINDAGGNGGGTNFLGSGGDSAFCMETMDSGGANRSGFFHGNAGYAGADTWQRIEMFFDRTNQTADLWLDGIYCKITNSGAGGDFEFRSNALKLYTANTSNNNRWNPTGMTGSGLNVGLVGHDDGHGSSAGNANDIEEIYVDTEFERFEISDSSTWDTGLNATATREICGRWVRNSGTSCTVYPNQGGFSSLSGKYLWYVTGPTTAVLVGQFT